MRSIFAKLIPFIFLGIAIVALIGGLILLSYLLIFGAILGLILFAISWIKNKFFPSKDLTSYEQRPRQGRTFDHEDNK